MALLKEELEVKGLNTVCQSAKRPNIGECFKKKTSTFLILGKNCMRKCAFCAIEKYTPESIDVEEPVKVAKVIKKLGLSYAVITPVTRDDLPDGGAQYFSETVNEIESVLPNIKAKVLVPDFCDRTQSINVVLSSKPDVFSYNLETAIFIW